MSSQTQKRKHKTLTIKEKNDILERLNRNESYSSLATKYGVGRSTIYDIKKNRENIQKFVSTASCGPGKRRTLKKAEHPEVEEALYKWFIQQRDMHTFITGPTLAMKAKFFYKEITKKDDFVANKGWLERFKNRHGIRLFATAKKRSNDTYIIELIKSRFLQKVSDLDLCPSQVYNVGETELFWRLIPSQKFVSYGEKSIPFANLKTEHVRILPCANAAGTHALKMVVVGKTKNPRELKNIDLPVHYFGQESAGMTKELLKKWFDECFVPEVREWLKDHNLPQKALLLLDNASGHSFEEELTTEDKCITAMFFPPNCPGLIKPMEKIIQFLKHDYKKNLLLTATSKYQPVEKTLKEFNMKDLVFALCQCWNNLPASNITSSWKNLWPDIVTTVNIASEVLEQVAADTQMSLGDLEYWWRAMDTEEGYRHEMSDEDIIKKTTTKINQEDDEDHQNDENDENNEDDERDEDDENKKDTKILITASQVSVEDAINAFELGLRWAEENGASSNELLVLRRLRDKALVSRFNNIKQENL